MTHKEAGAEIWTNFIDGDREALVKLYEQNYVGLMNYGSKFIKDRDEVNDYIMKMLIDLWEKKGKLPKVENVRAYLLTCLRRAILNRSKQEIWEDLPEKYIPESEGEKQHSYEDELVMLQSNQVLGKRLQNSLEKLSVRQKEMLQLKFFEDLSYEEIAEKCNISKRTAYNIVYDALKILREDLSDGKNQVSFYQIGLLLYGFSTFFEVVQK